MNSLMNYASDDENSNDSDEAKVTIMAVKSNSTVRRASDAIYDSVPMDMSEESNNNNSTDDSDNDRSTVRTRASGTHRIDSSRNTSSFSDQRPIDHEECSSSHNDNKHSDKSDDSKIDKYDRNNRHGSDKKRGSDSKDSKDSKRSRDDDRRLREDEKRLKDDEGKLRDSDRRKDKSNKEEKNDDRNEREHHRDDRRERDRRDDRDRRRDRDRERDRDRDRDRIRDRSRDISRERDRDREKDRDRRYSKDDKTRDRYRDDRRSRDRDRAKSRSRSKSRDRSHRSFSYREERNKTKLAQLEKLGIEIKATDNDSLNNSQEQHYYNPLATATQGKYAEQIQKRKLLWANKKQDDNKTSSTAGTANTWMGTTFTHDQDGKVTAKFKRLMGIKGDLPTTPAPGVKPDILKKQEEMFNNMEQQYEVARATTHTQRGVGLGYASGSFPFPR